MNIAEQGQAGVLDIGSGLFEQPGLLLSPESFTPEGLYSLGPLFLDRKTAQRSAQ